MRQSGEALAHLLKITLNFCSFPWRNEFWRDCQCFVTEIKVRRSQFLDTVLCDEESRECNLGLSEGEHQCSWRFEECSFQTMPENTVRCFKLGGTDISDFNLYHLRLWHINSLDRRIVDGVDIWKTNSSKVPDSFLYLFACLMSKRKLVVFCATVRKWFWVKSVYLAPSKADHYYAWVYGHCRFECGGGNSERLWGFFFFSLLACFRWGVSGEELECRYIISKTVGYILVSKMEQENHQVAEVGRDL